MKRYLFFISQDYSFAVLRPLQKEILSRGDDVRWFLYGDEVTYSYLDKDEKYLNNIDEVIKYNPCAVFVPGNVVPSFIPGLKVEVFHGLPSTKAKKNGQLYHYIIRGMFDLYCTQGPQSTKKFEELSRKYGYFCVEETGWCKLDPLFWQDEDKSTMKKKTILFASTFSPRFSKAKTLYPVILSMMKKYDFMWFITLHPKMDKYIVDLYRSIELPNVKFVDSTDLVDAFKQSDLMVCDTSSIIYEFLTQLKPVVTYQTQKEEPYFKNVTDIDKLEDTIVEILNTPFADKKELMDVVNEFHPYRDGKSSKRVLEAVDKMLDKRAKPKKRKPLNILRNLKLRKELDYWKFSFLGDAREL